MSVVLVPSGVNEEASQEHRRRDRNEFLALSNQVAEFGRSIGVEITPYRDPKLVHFTAAADSDRALALENLRLYVSICSDTIKDGASLRDTPQLTWFALRKMGYRPTSDLFSKLGDEQIVEIHNSSFQQVFRNFRFYDFCSYSLEELYSFHLNQLYHRDEKSMGYLMDYLQSLYAGKITSAIEYGGPPHLIMETQSVFKYQILDEITTIAPLYEATKSGGPIATITVENAQLIAQNELDGPAEERLLQLHKEL
jgi:hypothetical protein